MKFVEIVGSWSEEVDVNVTDARGRSPLMHAARSGDVKTSEILIRKGADPNAIDDGGMTALCYAVENLDYALTKLLLLSGASTDILNSLRVDPLLRAFRQKHYFLVDLLMEIRPPLQLTHEYEFLKIAVSKGWSSVVKRLVERCDVDVARGGVELVTVALSKLSLERIFEGNCAPRQLASPYGERLEIMRFLVSRGAGTDLPRDLAEKALCILVAHADASTVRSFVSQQLSGTDFFLKESPDILRCAVRNTHDPRVFKYVWESGRFDLSSRGRSFRCRLLRQVVEADNPSALKYLLKLGRTEEGSRKEATDEVHERDSLLELAVDRNSRGCARLLLLHGARANQRWLRDDSCTSVRDYSVSKDRTKNCRNKRYFAMTGYESPFTFARICERPPVLDLIRQTVLQHFCGEPVNPEDLRIIESSLPLGQICKVYRTELERMRKTRVQNGVSVFRVLVNPELFVRDEHVNRVLSDEATLSKFPVYRGILTEKLKKVRKRPLLVAQVEPILMRIFKCDPNRSFPFVFHKIAQYLHNRDIRNLILVF